MSESQHGGSGEQGRPAMAHQTDDGRMMIVTGDGMAVESAPGGDGEDREGDRRPSVTDMVSQPDKVMRVGTMIRQLLDEVKAAPLDDSSRQRLREIHAASISELKEGLSPELGEELSRLSLPFDSDAPSDAELRIAHAQLVGWLEGLFQGIQTALFAQQMASRAQLEQVRRALPGGPAAGPGPAQEPPGRSGMYL